MLMESDEEDWEAVDLLVANRQKTQQVSQSAGTQHEALRSIANCPRPVHFAAARVPAKDRPQLPGPLCRHGVPLVSCGRRAEHLTEIKESLLGLMTRLLDEPQMPPDDKARLMAERQRLQAEQASLETAPPLAAQAQRAETAGAPPVPATPAHGRPQATVPSAVLRQSLSQTSQHGAQQGTMGLSRPLGPLPGTCHSCGEAGHWASSCPQRGAGGAGPGFGGMGGGCGPSAFSCGGDGLSGAGGGEFRPPDPALRGGSDAAAAEPAGQCRWQEGTNEPQWSRRFPWTPVRMGSPALTAACPLAVWFSV